MPELAALVISLDKLNLKLDSTQKSLDHINERLDALPEDYIPRDEAKNKARRIRAWIIGLGVGGVLLASTLGISLYASHKTTCGVRGIISLASTSTTRNPIPADLDPESRARVEAQRAQAAAFYDDALKELPVLWGC